MDKLVNCRSWFANFENFAIKGVFLRTILAFIRAQSTIRLCSAPMKPLFLFASLLLTGFSALCAETNAPAAKVLPKAPAVMPGKGIKQHPFLYAGEWDTRKPFKQSMFIVRNGKVVWQYSHPLRNAAGGIQEFDDATLLPNGNVIFSYMSGAAMLSQEKDMVWQYPAPPGTVITVRDLFFNVSARP